MQRQARLFRLVRHTDRSGLHATGILAEGVEWSDGAVALRWRGPWPSTSTWDGGVEAVLAVHGTGGRTQVHWLPGAPAVPGKAPPPLPAEPAEPADPVETVWLPAPGIDGRCTRCGRPWPCLSCGP